MRQPRHLALVLACALICAMFAVAPHSLGAQTTSKTFTVTTTGDSFSDPTEGCQETTNEQAPPGCTLRQALNAVAATGNFTGTSIIDFNIPFNDPGFVSYPNTAAWVISPTVALPPISHDKTILDGSTQTNRAGNTNNDGAEIIISGGNVDNTGGLSIDSNNNTVRGIGIINFRGNATSLTGVGMELNGDNNIIQGNYIGIGISATGTVAAPNRDAGIIINSGSNDNLIGGDNTSSTTQFNVISGNSGDGILINGAQSNNIAGNYIGTNANITAAIPNGGSGINIRANASGNIIGNYLAQASVSSRNFIGGNGGYGVQITNSKNNKIYGNFIGLNRFGTGKISNTLGGVRIDGTSTNTATGNEIGGTAAGAQYGRNYIVGTGGAGVQLNGFGARLNRVVANYVGIGSTGVVIAGSNQFSGGVLLTSGASDNTVGGSTSAGETNVISGISGDAVQVTGLLQGTSMITARNNKIQGNYIGLGTTGSAIIPNTGYGILLNNYVANTTIGGTSATQGNRIANNALDGIRVTGTRSLSTTISSNTIRSNGGTGVLVNGTNVQTTTLTGNFINLNQGDGVQIAGGSTTTIFSNTVGLQGGDALGNAGAGIRVTNSVSTTIQATKVISNGSDGLALSGLAIGRVTGNTIARNAGNGINVLNGSSAINITNNTIYTNTLAGVQVGDATFPSQTIRIIDNSISNNRTKGIALVPTTAGLPGVATNSNHDIDAPFGIRVNQSGRVTGRVYANPAQPASCITCTIQLFTSDPTLLDGQGKTRVDSQVNITANGYFTATVSGALPKQLALTATDSAGNTSEFAAFTATLGLTIGPARSGSAAPGDTISYTHRITNTGTVTLDDLRLSAVSNKGWTATTAPAAPISLNGGESKTVTVTLTLPKAPNATVLAGTVDLTRLTVSSVLQPTATAAITDTTTVASAFKLEVTPLTASALIAPGRVITYSHTLRNAGNLTGTVALSASTDLGWTTTVTPTQITLGPGQEKSVSVGVTAPSQTLPAGTRATTSVGFRTTSPTGQAPIYATDTSIIALQPLVFFVPNNEGQTQPGKTITFIHTVTNNSNGPITLKLPAARTSLGSTVAFCSATSGVTLGSDNSFTLAQGAQLQLLVDVTVNADAPVGSVDLVTLTLAQSDGTLVASVQDTVRVIGVALPNKTYLPLIKQVG